MIINIPRKFHVLIVISYVLSVKTLLLKLRFFLYALFVKIFSLLKNFQCLSNTLS